jgi:Uma2 family endonuclease
MTTAGPMTADELLHLELPGKSVELVKGRLVVREPPGMQHGRIVAELAYRLTDYVKAGDLGRVYAAETGFKLARDPDTVRAPDIAFVARERLPAVEPEGYAELAPDLAVEVLSPSDRPGELLAKVADWLNAGTRLVWVVDPSRRQVRIYRDDGSESLLAEGSEVEGEGVLPGFALQVGQIL